MKRPIASATVFALSVFFVVLHFGGEEFVRTYREKLQVPMFAGYLTLAGFILSLKTNILLKLYADLFNTDEYLERVRRAEAVRGKPVPRFGPLIDLGNFLIWTVLSSLGCSILQMSVGFIYRPWSTAICLGSATAAMAFTLSAWFAIRANLQSWFEILGERDEARRRVTPKSSQT